MATETLSLRRVLDVALDITRSEGLDAVSMRRLADALGVRPTSVYHHLGSGKDHLLELIVEHVGGTVPRPSDEGPWADRLRQWAYAIREALLAHPGLAGYLLSRGPAGPNGLRLAESALTALRDAGVGTQDRLHAYAELNLLVLTSVHREQAGHLARSRAATIDALRRLGPDEVPLVRALLDEAASVTEPVHFDRALDLYLAGVRAIADTGSGPLDQVKDRGA
jgi:AcrR family transcriptional regulator